MIAVLALAASANASCLVAQGSDVWTGTQRATQAAYVVMRDGVIDSVVEPGTAIGEDCVGIGSGSSWVTPGMVAVPTQLGVTEVSLGRGTVDATVEEQDPIRAALRVVDAYNPRSTLIPITRVGGVTSAVVAPDGGLIGGQAGWVDLAGASQAVAVRDGSVAMVAAASSGGNRAAGLLRLREAITEARWYADKGSAWEDGRTRDPAAEPLDLAALAPVARGELPLLVTAHRASDLEALVRLAEELEVGLIVQGAAEGWLVADLLRDADVAVIVDPPTHGAGSFDQINGRPDNAALLVEAGVDVVLSSFQTHNARGLRVVAGNAVRGGMPYLDALAAVTSTPARVFGMDDHGTLEAGKVANLVVWSGDSLEIGTRVQAVVIAGNVVPTTTRQTELRDRYRALPGTPLGPVGTLQ